MKTTPKVINAFDKDWDYVQRRGSNSPWGLTIGTAVVEMMLLFFPFSQNHKNAEDRIENKSKQYDMTGQDKTEYNII